MNKSYSHTMNTNKNVGKTTTLVGKSTANAVADDTNFNNNNMELDMGDDNVTRAENLENQMLENGFDGVGRSDVSGETAMSDFEELVKTISKLNEKPSFYYNYMIPITREQRYLAAKSIDFNIIPESIISKMKNALEHKDSLSAMQKIINIIFDPYEEDNGKSYNVFELPPNEVSRIIDDFEDLN